MRREKREREEEGEEEENREEEGGEGGRGKGEGEEGEREEEGFDGGRIDTQVESWILEISNLMSAFGLCIPLLTSPPGTLFNSAFLKLRLAKAGFCPGLQRHSN